MTEWSRARSSRGGRESARQVERSGATVRERVRRELAGGRVEDHHEIGARGDLLRAIISLEQRPQAIGECAVRDRGDVFARASGPVWPPSTAYTNSVHGPPTKPIRALRPGQPRARRPDGVGLEREGRERLARRPSFARTPASAAAASSGATVVVAQARSRTRRAGTTDR